MIISSTLDEIPKIRTFVREFCKSIIPPLPEDRLDDLDLAIQEAVSNIVRHAYQNRNDGTIQATITRTPQGILIELKDRGVAFSQGSKPLFNPDTDNIEEKTGGFGRYIIQQIMDEVSYERDDTGTNRTRLFMKFDQAI